MLQPDTATTETLTIGNTGAATLTWCLTEIRPVTWLQTAPVSGAVGPDASVPVDVTFDATGWPTDTYTTTLQIESNALNQPTVDVSVTLVVTDCIPVSGADFTYAPASPQINETITFTGTVGQDSEFITYTWDFGDDEVGAGQVITHAYHVTDTFTVMMTATNDCGEQGVVTHPVTVTAAVPTPDIEVDPLSLSARLNPGDATTRMLTISNTGAADLTWRLTETTPVTWLHASPDSGAVAPGGSANVAVRFEPGDMLSDTYTTTLRINSDDPDQDAVDAGVVLTVTTDCIPVSGADFTPDPTSPQVGETITFVGGVMEGTKPITYAWDFGDDEVGAGQVITHTYDLSGTYTVVLTTTNACGQDVVSDTVPVSAVGYDVYLPLVLRNYP
jgi:PKD repeat protein